MGIIASLENRKQLWRRPPDVKRYKKSHPPTCMSSAWFKKHGPLRARITRNGDLFLDHDSFRSMPSMVIGDLLERGVVVYFAGENRLGLEHKLHCLIGGDQKVRNFIATPGSGKVPRGVTRLSIVMQFGKKDGGKDILVDEDDDDEEDECTYQEMLICEVSTICDLRNI